MRPYRREQWASLVWNVSFRSLLLSLEVGKVAAVTLEVVKLTPCFVCGIPVIYFGPKVFEDSKRLCSTICVAIDDVLTPGHWVDATEMMEGGRLHDHLPDIWSDPNQ